MPVGVGALGIRTIAPRTRVMVVLRGLRPVLAGRPEVRQQIILGVRNRHATLGDLLHTNGAQASAYAPSVEL